MSLSVLFLCLLAAFGLGCLYLGGPYVGGAMAVAVIALVAWMAFRGV